MNPNTGIHGHTKSIKSEGKADITTQNASSHMRSSPSKVSKPLNHEEIAF